MPANLENSAEATGLEKVTFHSNPQKSNAKECSNYHTVAVISHASKLILKIPQVRLQQYLNWELPDVQTGFRKGRGNQRSNCQHPLDHRKKQESSRKTSALLTMPKPLTVWITTKCGKFLKRWEYQIILPVSWQTYMQVKTQQLELDMEQWTGSKFRKEYVKAVYCHPAYLTSM